MLNTNLKEFASLVVRMRKAQITYSDSIKRKVPKQKREELLIRCQAIERQVDAALKQIEVELNPVRVPGLLFNLQEL